MTQISTEGWVDGYDAVDWQRLPAGPVHFVYVDGDYAIDAAGAAAVLRMGEALSIAVFSGTAANEYDYENGNQNDPVSWVRNMRNVHGYTGVVYCAEASVPAVLGLFETAQIDPPYFSVANWTGHRPDSVTDYGAGTVSVQYASNNFYDTRIVSPHYPRIGAATTTPATGPTTTEDDMIIIRVKDETAVYGMSGSRLWHIVDEESLAAYIAAGIKQITVSAGEINSIHTAA